MNGLSATTTEGDTLTVEGAVEGLMGPLHPAHLDRPPARVKVSDQGGMLQSRLHKRHVVRLGIREPLWRGDHIINLAPVVVKDAVPDGRVVLHFPVVVRTPID